jgi:hypothetical protein
MAEDKSSKSVGYSAEDNHFKCYSSNAYLKKKISKIWRLSRTFLYWYFGGSENCIIYRKFNTGWDELNKLCGSRAISEKNSFKNLHVSKILNISTVLSLLLEFSSILQFTRFVLVFKKYNITSKTCVTGRKEYGTSDLPGVWRPTVIVFLFCRHCRGRREEVIWPRWRMEQESLFSCACR